MDHRKKHLNSEIETVLVITEAEWPGLKHFYVAMLCEIADMETSDPTYDAVVIPSLVELAKKVCQAAIDRGEWPESDMMELIRELGND